MNTIGKIGIGIGVAAIAVCVFPCLKGPYNRVKNNINEKVDSEFVVDNYKAEYVNLYDKKAEVEANLRKLNIESKVTQKKLEYARTKCDTAKSTLIATGSNDLKAFSRAKDVFESAKTEVSNLEMMLGTYSNAVKKLEDAITLIDVNMSKAKTNVAILESKKTLFDNLKNVNETVESINGLGSGTLAFNVEKLNDDTLRESIKLEALKSDSEQIYDKAAADAYLNSL